MVHPDFRPFAERSTEARRRFLEDLASPHEVQTRLLLDECIAPNRDTAFGREHGFADIRTVEDFRRAVPIRSYDELAPWFDRAAAGEARVLTSDAPIAFSRTSGTSGAAKKVPCTAHFQDHHEQRRFYTNFGNVIAHHPEALDALDATWDLTWAWCGPPTADVTSGGIPYLSIAERLTSPAVLDAEGIPLPGCGAPWSRPPADLLDRTERAYWSVRTAAEMNPRAIISINPSTLLSIAQLLGEMTERIIGEIREGTVIGRPVGSPNPARADELARIAREVGGTLLPLHVWPRISVIECWTGGSCALYLPRVRSTFGPDVDFLCRGISGTESPIAIPVDRHPTSCPLYVCTSFLEFLAVDRDDGPALGFADLQLGAEYEVVLTQPSGLYRYSLGDVVRVVGWFGAVPRVEFVGRRGLTSSFTGEKLTEPQVVSAIETAVRACAVDVSGITCCPVWGEPPHYSFVVEAAAPIEAPALAALARALDEALGRHNDEYPGKRASRRLGPVRVHLVAPGTFARRRDEAAAAGASAIQVKDKPLQQDGAALVELLALSDAEPVSVEG